MNFNQFLHDMSTIQVRNTQRTEAYIKVKHVIDSARPNQKEACERILNCGKHKMTILEAALLHDKLNTKFN